MPRSAPVWTREQLNVLDTWPDITMKEVAKRLGKSIGTAHRWLAMLGAIQKYPSLDVPTYTGNEPHCTRCRIILSEAPEGENGECGHCLIEEDYLVKLWANEQRTPGYVIDIGELILVNAGGRR